MVGFWKLLKHFSIWKCLASPDCNRNCICKSTKQVRIPSSIYFCTIFLSRSWIISSSASRNEILRNEMLWGFQDCFPEHNWVILTGEAGLRMMFFGFPLSTCWHCWALVSHTPSYYMCCHPPFTTAGTKCEREKCWVPGKRQSSGMKNLSNTRYLGIYNCHNINLHYLAFMLLWFSYLSLDLTSLHTGVASDRFIVESMYWYFKAYWS